VPRKTPAPAGVYPSPRPHKWNASDEPRRGGGAPILDHRRIGPYSAKPRTRGGGPLAMLGLTAGSLPEPSANEEAPGAATGQARTAANTRLRPG